MIYRFGVFEFHAASFELRRSGRTVPLEPQPAKALALLLAKAGGPVSRDQMSAHIWGQDTHVDFDRGLAYCIAQIRSALGDSADNPRFVETLPRRGFRFIAPLQPIAPVAAVAGRASSRTRLYLAAAVLLCVALGIWGAVRLFHRPRPIVAVSLFDNETGDSRYDRAVHSLSDVVVDRLTQLGTDRIGVIGNAAVLRIPRNERDLKKIAADTGAAYVVLAQLQTKNDELSLLMQLIKLDDGTHLWTRRLSRPTGDNLTGLDEDAARMLEAAARQYVLRDL